MKIVEELLQGSTEWHTWRQNHITATNAAVIMGLNPWATKHQLWEEKTLGWINTPTQKEIDRMSEGTRLEPMARQALIDEIGVNVEPFCAESTEIPYLGASFDGIPSCRSFVVEIKCGRKSYDMAKSGLIPDYYLAQIQHQLYVSSVQLALYWAFREGEKGILIEVERNENFIKIMLEKEIEFWNCVQTFQQPRD